MKPIIFHNLGVRNITSRRYLAPLLIGILVGFIIANIFISIEPNSLWFGFSTITQHAILRDPHSSGDLTDAEGPEKGIVFVFLPHEIYVIASSFDATTFHAYRKDVGFHASHEGVHAHENRTIAQQLYNDVRILCWIMTTPKNHQKKARHVKRTWGSRCNRLLFMSTSEGIIIKFNEFFF